MTLGLSPSIHIEEEDFQNAEIVPGANFAAMAGNFTWGACNSIITISNETELVNKFGKPTDDNYLDWFAAASHLAYNDKLYVVRAVNADSKNAGVMILNAPLTTLTVDRVLVENEEDIYHPFVFAEDDVITSGEGETLKTGVVAKVLDITEDKQTLLVFTDDTFVLDDVINTGLNYASVMLAPTSSYSYEYSEKLIENSEQASLPSTKPDMTTILNGSSDKCKFVFIAKYPGVYEKNLTVKIATPTTFDSDANFKSYFGVTGLQAKQVAVLVGYTTEQGSFVPFDREAFIVSTVRGTFNEFGRSDFIENYINTNSAYVYCYVNENAELPVSLVEATLTGGVYTNLTSADYVTAYNRFASSEEVDINVIFSAGADTVNSGAAISSISTMVQTRKDCRYTISALPSKLAGLPRETSLNNLKNYFNDVDTGLSSVVGNNSYTAFYGDAKYMYDKYNDAYRWVSIAGDIAGIYTQTLMWLAPAGINRAIIKNCIKLAFNPSESERDQLYPLNINPVYTIRGSGHVVFGQKTLWTSTQSIFNRVDNRGLFIYLQKNSKKYLRNYQFEKNNEDSRTNLLNELTPVFEYVLGRGGIAAYKLTCDSTNNPNTYSNILYVDAAIQIVGSIEWLSMRFRAVPNMVNVTEQE